MAWFRNRCVEESRQVVSKITTFVGFGFAWVFGAFRSRSEGSPITMAGNCLEGTQGLKY